MTTPAITPRFCPVCAQVDDHPRHDFWLTDPRVAPHMDCCASQVCPDGSCTILVAELKGSKTGDEFRKAIVGMSTAVQKKLNDRDADTKHFTLADLRPEVHGAIIAAPTELRGV